MAVANPALAQGALKGFATAVIENADERVAARISAVFELLGAVPRIHAPLESTGLSRDIDPDRPIPKFGFWTSTVGAYWERPQSGSADGYHGRLYAGAIGVGLPLHEPWRGSLFVGLDRAEVDYDTGETVRTNAGFTGMEVRRTGENGVSLGLAGVFAYTKSEADQPIPIGTFVLDATGNYDSYFGAIVGSAGKRISLSGPHALRMTASAGYAGEWTEQYDFGLSFGSVTVDETYTHAINGQFEVALERVLQFGEGAAVEAFAGTVVHKVVGGDQDVVFKGTTFDIGDSMSDSIGGYLGAGFSGKFGGNWRASARAQVYYGSDETFATGGILRLVGIF